MFELKIGINQCSNELYHEDVKFLSSSDYKLLLKNPKEFYDKKFTIQAPRPENPAFTQGSGVHTLILEPHLFNSEFAIFDGMRKQGAIWEAFKAENKKQYILSKPQHMQCLSWVSGYKKNKLAVELISGGLSEHTVAQIYNDVPTKVRTDYVNLDKGYVVDIKTSSFPVDRDSFKQTVAQWDYGLSAALYCDVLKQFYGKDFEFYFVAISKIDGQCEVYKLSEATRSQGLMKIGQAISIYKSCLLSGSWVKSESGLYVPNEEILEV
jgi:hypothetical protein